MADVDEALAATAVALNEEAKAERKKRGKAVPEAATETVQPRDLAPGEMLQEGDLGEGYSYDDEGFVVGPDGKRTGARRLRDDGDLTGAVGNLGAALNKHDGGEEKYDLTGAAHDLAIDRMEAMASETQLVLKSLVPDARNFLLDQIKSRPKPWSGTSQAEQRDVAAACEHAANELVRKIAEAIATAGKDSVRVLLTKVTLGDDIVIAGKVKTFGDEDEDRAVGILNKARGKHVMITVASADDYKNGPEAQTDADQHDMGFEAGSDTAPPADED